MGIQTTVKATREATKEELVSLCLLRLDRMLLHGTTTVEGKSGYGLNFEDEIKQLEALQEADGLHPLDVISTFMGAHEIPPEYKTRKNAYIDLLIDKILPEVKKDNLAEFFDVFCEEGVYSIEETRKLVRAAKEAGFKIKIHADEFSPLGGAQLAAEEGASSADHLINITDEGIQKLAQSQTAAILLSDARENGSCSKAHRKGNDRRPGHGFQPGKLNDRIHALCPAVGGLHPEDVCRRSH